SSSLCRMFPWLVRLGSWIVLISSFSVSTLIFPILPLLLQKVNAVAVAVHGRGLEIIPDLWYNNKVYAVSVQMKGVI
ncbi:MAG: hypothetical protein IJM46_08270, partial [Oscillospiraceae bacterium]|nr:hypothetical protein [Oscillospiraceae bacterium]